MKAADAASRIIAALVIIIPVALIAVLFLPRALPWWGDGGDWLKRVNAILGNNYPMWQQTTFQYPPLFMLLVAGASKFLGEVLALKLMALAAYGLFPLTTYFLTKELFGGRVVAIGSAWLAGFTPIWVEMIGWGGYPDLLGLAMLSFAFYGIFRYKRSGTRGNLIILAAGSVIVPLTHHLTFITFIGVLVLWGLASIKFDRPSLKPLAMSIAATLVTFGLYRLFAGPLQFVLFNTAALSYLQTSGGTLLYMFKSWFLFGLLYATALGSAVYLFVEKESRGKAVFLVAWTLFPVLATQGYLVGLAVDYNRVLFFFAQPLMILVAAPLVHLGGAWRRLRGLKLSGTSVALGRRLVEGTLLPKQFGRKVAAVLLLALTVSSMAYTALAGSVTIGNVNTWYNSPNIDPYGDQLALQAVNYIHASTSPTAVIVAEYPIGRWIEGIAQRRVVLQLDPRYLFLTGEVDREYAARAIMTSDHGIRNGYAWVLDQAPYGTYSPLISFFTQGEYANMVYVNDTLTQVTWENTATGLNYTRPLTNATTITSSWVTNDSQGATLAVTYGFGAFSVTRSVGLTASSGYVNLSFNASSNNPHVVVTNLAVAVISFPGAGPDSASLVGNRTLMETTSVGPIYFYSSSFTAFPFDFTGNALTGGITGSITMWNGGDGNGTFLYAYDRPQVLSQFGVTDIVIPNTAPLLVPVGQPVRIERNIQTSSLYQNLLKDPEFSVVYFNDQDIVLTVASQSGG